MLDAGSALLSSNWQVGDRVIGIGATVDVTTDLSNSVRIVAKYGSDNASFSASSGTTPPGNGNGSFSGGFGGTGSILMSTAVGRITAGNANTILSFGASDSLERYNGTSVDSLAPALDFGKFIYQANNVGNNLTNLLSSFEVYLNISQLERLGYTDLPTEGDLFALTLQRSTNATLFTDALGQTEAVPEPASLVLSGMGLAGLVGYLRRRNKVGG